MQDFERAAELAGSLQSSLSAVTFPLTEPVEQEIRHGVCAYADELKGLGLPPERVIVAIKRVANEAGIRSTSRVVPAPLSVDGVDKLLVDIVGWCIERYFTPAPRAD